MKMNVRNVFPCDCTTSALGKLFNRARHLLRAQVGKLRPGGHMWPVEVFHLARSGFVIMYQPVLSATLVRQIFSRPPS